MKLYLVRHAIAQPRSSTPDAERVLTDDGKAKMERATRGLRALKVTLDLVLTSPLRRARETAEILSQGLGMPPVEVVPELATGGDVAAVVRALRAYPDSDAVALVGHQPDLGHLASLLLTGSPTSCELDFKKGGVACLEGERSDRMRCSLRWLVTSKVLRSL